MTATVKSFALKYPILAKYVIRIINSLPFNNKVTVRNNNKMTVNGGMLLKTKVIVKGYNNEIIIQDMARLVNTKISISGNDNKIYIDRKAYIENGDFCIEDNGGIIKVGEHTIISGYTHIAEIEGTTIEIGKECLFSAGITIRSGDSHSVLDRNKNRINPSKSVKIGDNVWIGNGATILKGVEIPSNCIIATQAVVTKSPGEANCILGGNPAQIIKRDVNWSPARLKIL